MAPSSEFNPNADVLLSCLEHNVKFIELRPHYVAGEEIYYEGKCPICNSQMPPENILNQTYHKAGIRYLYVNYDGDVCLFGNAYLDLETKQVKFDLEGFLEYMKPRQTYREWAVKTLPEYVKFLKQLAAAHLKSEEDKTILNAGISILSHRIAECAEDYETAYNAYMQYELYYEDKDAARDQQEREWHFLRDAYYWVASHDWLSKNTGYLKGCYELVSKLADPFDWTEEAARDIYFWAGFFGLRYADSLPSTTEREKTIKHSISLFTTSLDIARTRCSNRGYFSTYSPLLGTNENYIVSSLEYIGDLYRMSGDNEAGAATYTLAWKTAEDFIFSGTNQAQSIKARDQFVARLEDKYIEAGFEVVKDQAVDRVRRNLMREIIASRSQSGNSQAQPNASLIVREYLEGILSFVDKDTYLHLYQEIVPRINIVGLCGSIRSYILTSLCFNMIDENLPPTKEPYESREKWRSRELKNAKYEHLSHILDLLFKFTSVGNKNRLSDPSLTEEDMPTLMRLVVRSLDLTEKFLNSKGKTIRRIRA